MRNIILIIPILFFTFYLKTNLYGQSWNWMIKGDGITTMQGQSNTINNIVQSDNGFLYVTGSFRDTLIIEDDTLVANDFTDAFVAKFNTQQNLIWVKHISSSGVTDCKGLTIDENGKIVIGGYFQGDLTYDSGLNLSSPGASELFMFWLDQLGNIVQHEYTSGCNYCEIFDIAVDQNNNVLAAGNFLGQFNHDNVNLNSIAGLNFFCIKVNSAGFFEWGAQSIGGGNLANGISLDSENEVYIAGSFEDGADIGGSTYTSANGNHNMFVAKYNSAGNSEWVYTVTGFDEIHGNNIHVNSNNTIGVVGEFRQIAEVGTDTLLQSQGNYDILFLTLTENGDYIKAQGFGGLNNDIPTDMDSDFYGNFIIGGKIGYGAEFGDTTVSAVGTANTFVTKIKRDSVKWVRTIPGTGLNEGLCLHYGLNEKIYCGGTLRDSVFIANDTLTAPSGKDFYLAELGDYINHDDYASVKENIKESIIKVFPNPGTGLFYISSSSPIQAVQIYNLSGQLIQTVNNSNTYPLEIDITSTNSGIYLLRVQTETETTVLKTIKTD